MSKSLRELREAAGLTIEQTAKKVHEIEPSAPETKVGYWHIENKGTDRVRLINAIATVLEVDRAVVECAALSELQKV